MKKFLVPSGLLILILLMGSSASALTLKLGSIAPDGSPWDIALKQVAAQWSKITNGKVRVKIYPGGIVGSESDMIRKMRIGQLHAAIFTGIGMSNIAPEVIALSLPYMVNNDTELDYLMNKTTAGFEKNILKKGFKVISWSKAGWVYCFSKKPVFTPADLKKQKFAVSSNPTIIQSWRAIGFNAVPISTSDLMASLQSGMVEAYYTTPLVAAAFQWFALSKNMCSLKIGPMVGGLVVHKKAWDKIPEKYRPKLIAAARKIIKGLYKKTLSLERKAMNTMKKHGLKVNRPTAAQARLWKKEAQKGYNVFVGKTFSIDLLNEMKRIMREYRKR